MQLNDAQVQVVIDRLMEVEIGLTNLREELIDHICCDIESRLLAGQSFEAALQAAFDTFSEDEMKEIERQTIQFIHQPTLIMKKVSLATLACLLFVSTFIWGKQDPPYLTPLKGEFQISSAFGMRMHPLKKEKKMHTGIDFKAPLGTVIVATGDGVVLEIKHSDKGYGNRIIIQHDEHYQTLYSQMQEAFFVKVGDQVKAGTPLGTVGSSGASTGPHLHYEVLKDGKHQDPEEYLGL